MHRHAPLVLLLLAAAFAPASAGRQEPAKPKELWARCGSQIDWLTDGVVLADGESIGMKSSKPTASRAELLDQAKKKSIETKRLVLWYVPRTTGRQMNRAALLDGYLKAVAWSDPDVVELIRRKFVPLRMSADASTGGPLGVKPFDFVEPGFVFLNGEGEVVHKIDRLRTFSSDWIVDTLVRVLAKNEAHNTTGATRAEDLLLGGDWEKAIKAADGKRAGQLIKARALRRLRRVDDLVKTLDGLKDDEEAAVERARLLLNQANYGEAQKVLEASLKLKGPRTAEAHYWLAWLAWNSGREEDARKTWAKLCGDFSDSPWAWRAAGNVIKGSDTNLDGPIVHEFEEVAWWPEVEGVPTRTMHSRGEKDVDDVVKRAIAWLIRHQRSDGAWTDSRYVMCPDPKILPNVFVAVAALGATALLEWRDVDPKACDAARAKAEKYLLDETHLNRKNNEEIYADGYRLLYLARKAAKGEEKAATLKRAAEIAGKLAVTQNKAGLWAHEYPNPFCTAAVLFGVQQAKAAGAEIDETMIAKGVAALKKTRGPNGRQPYAAGPASPPKDASARGAACDIVLHAAKEITEDDLAASVELYWTWVKNSEAVRVCDFHADGELGGFFFFHGFYHMSEAAAGLSKEKGAPFLAKVRDHLLAIPEWDGSFLDSHELGKCYGTAMALLSMKRTR